MKSHTTLIILKAWRKQATGGKQAKNPEVGISSLLALIQKLNYILQENDQNVQTRLGK